MRDDAGTPDRTPVIRDRLQLSRRLGRLEGQVRGIARMIERGDDPLDVLQQTAALRAAVDAVAVLVLEEHVAARIRQAAAEGEPGSHVDEALELIRRSHGRPVRPARPAG